MSENTTGWTNLGKFTQFILKEKISSSQKIILIYLVQESFGYMNSKTPKLPLSKIAKNTGLSIKTVWSSLLVLIDCKYVKQIKPHKFTGDGKEAYSYSVEFKKDIYVKLKEGERNESTDRDAHRICEEEKQQNQPNFHGWGHYDKQPVFHPGSNGNT